MKKIRKFKISAHYRELHRRLKKSNIDLNSLALEDKNQFTQFVSSLLCCVQASVLYKTLENPKETTKTATVGALTLGKNLEDKINSLLSNEQKKAARICSVEFLDSAFDFVSNLIKEEAKKENSDTLPAKIFLFPKEADCGTNSTLTARFIRKSEIPCEEEKTKILPIILEKLDTSKISLSFKENRPKPYHSVAFLTPWIYKKTAKHR